MSWTCRVAYRSPLTYDRPSLAGPQTHKIGGVPPAVGSSSKWSVVRRAASYWPSSLAQPRVPLATRAAGPSSCRSDLMGAATTVRGDQAAAAASSSIARVAAATRPRCRRNNIPPHTSSVAAPDNPLPARRIDATGRSGFKTTLSPLSADAEQPQCSAFSVFIAFGPSGNGPSDSSFVHAYERTQTGESPAARYRALTAPTFTPCGWRRRETTTGGTSSGALLPEGTLSLARLPE
jgi:hypothetical protein